jgi:6 kDa early secretory antigenic target
MMSNTGGTSFAVTPARVSQVGGDLSTGAGDIESINARLVGEVNALVEDGWTGAASGAFQDLYQEWHTASNNLNQALQGIAQLMGRAASTYAETEQQNQRLFSAR